MRKYIVLIFFLIFTLSACGETKQSTESAEDKYDTDYKLIVNGKDITEGNYVHVHNASGDASIPITAVMRELGASVNWANESIVTFESGVYRRIIDTSKPAFGRIPPPGRNTGAYTNVINGEVIFDLPSVEYMLAVMGAECYIDKDEKVIEIRTITESSLEYHTMEEFESYIIGEEFSNAPRADNIIDGTFYYLMENGDYICVKTDRHLRVLQEITVIPQAEHPYAQYFTDSPEESATITPEVEE